MSNFLDLFIRKDIDPEVSMTCLSASGFAPVVDYSTKDDRSSKLTYEGIGKVKYGSGVPPSVYDNAVNAIKAFPIVYSCVTARSEALAGLSIKVYDKKGGQESEVVDHPYYTVFDNPNPYQGSFEFLEQVSQSLDVTGNAFISKEGSGKTLELYLLPTKYVAIIPDSKNKIKEYHYYINGAFVKYKPEEMIHIKYSDVDDSYYGAPPLASANDVLTFEGYRIEFANTYFKNGAVPAGLLYTDAVLGDGLLKKLRGEWERIHGGIKNSSKIAILQGGLKYSSLTSPLKDLELSNLKRLSNDDIKLIFKVNDAVLGSLEGTGGKEGKDALTAFWRSSMIPHVQRIESALNRGLKNDLFKSGKQLFRFNLTNVAALSDSKESTATYISTLMAASVITANEGRAILGFPPSTDANASILLISNSFFGNQMMPAGQSNTNTEKPTVKPDGQATAPSTAVTVPAVPKTKKDYDVLELERAQVDRDTALASTGQLRFTPKYLEKSYGLKAEDIEIVDDARTVDIMHKEFRVWAKNTKEELSASIKRLDAEQVQSLTNISSVIETKLDEKIESVKSIIETTKLTAKVEQEKLHKSINSLANEVGKVANDVTQNTKEVKLNNKHTETNTATFKDVLIASNKGMVEQLTVSMQAMTEAIPKHITITNPPMDINLQVDTKSGNVKRTATFIRDENGDMVSATTEEISE